jgi:hypothetical protein
MFQSYFIHFHFANPVVFPEFTRWNESAQQKAKQFLQSTRCVAKNCFFFVGVCRHSAVATQKTIHAPPRACKSPAEERALSVRMG